MQVMSCSTFFWIILIVFSMSKRHYYVNDPFKDDSSESQDTDTSNESDPALTKKYRFGSSSESSEDEGNEVLHHDKVNETLHTSSCSEQEYTSTSSGSETDEDYSRSKYEIVSAVTVKLSIRQKRKA